MTSANVVEYRIEKEKDNEDVGHFRKHMMCTLPYYSDLLKYEPLEDHQITPYGYDEEEEYWEGNTVNLKTYLEKMTKRNKAIREYFENKSKKI